MMTRAFEPLGLHPQQIQAVTTLGFTTPTPIQFTVIPFLLSAQDMVGLAHTGTGKTPKHRPTDVAGTITYTTDKPGRTIGAIKIRAAHFNSDVPEGFVQQELAKKRGYQMRNQRSTI